MKPNDIIPGALYKHENHKGVVYLGCGDFWDGLPAKRKFLIILKEPDAKHKFVGIKVAPPKNDGGKRWWAKISAAPNNVL